MTRLLPRLFCSFTEVGDDSKQHMFHISAQRQLLFTSWQCQLSPTTLLQGVKWHRQTCNYLAICFLSLLITQCLTASLVMLLKLPCLTITVGLKLQLCMCTCLHGEMCCFKKSSYHSVTFQIKQCCNSAGEAK